jgi:hypothetical protein
MKKSEFKVFYILWNPTHPAPPTATFEKLEDAHECARAMALRHHEQFYVMQAQYLYETETKLKETKAV